MLTVEQAMASQKANFETLLGLTYKAFEGVEKMVELNLTASKAALTEIGDHAKAVMSAKDAQEVMALQSGFVQPLSEKTAAYSRHLYDIATGSSAELVKAIEEQAADTQKSVMGLIDNASSQEHQIALLWQAVATLSEERASGGESCVPPDAARDASFEAAKLNQLVDR